MEFNDKFYHDALRALQVGTTKDQFAESYANASNNEKDSSIWNQLYENGKQIFKQNLDIVEANDKIDQKEFNLFSHMLGQIQREVEVYKKYQLKLEQH